MKLSKLERLSALMVFTALVISGCSGGSPTSPSMGGTPSNGGTSNGLSGGSVIDGQVVNSGNQSQSGVQVSLNGTGQSDMTDSRGRFRLASVPAGQPQLRLQRAGMDMTVTLQRLSANQMVQVTVQVGTSQATVMGDNRSTMAVVDAYAVSVNQGTQTILLRGNVTVRVDANTVFDNDGAGSLGSLAQIAAALVAGQLVEIEAAGVADANGIILAAMIDADASAQAPPTPPAPAPPTPPAPAPPTPPAPPAPGTPPAPGAPGSTVNYEGYVTAVNMANTSFTLYGKTVVTNAQTVYTGDLTSFAAIAAAVAAGQQVEAEVTGTVQADGSVLAAQVDAELDDDANELEGYITAVNMATTSFTLNGKTVVTNAQTVYTGDLTSFTAIAAAVAAGQKVEAEVTGAVQANGSILAAQVEAELDDADADDADDQE